MVDDAGPIYLVRCRCGDIVPLSLADKAVCAGCGEVFGPWGAYLKTRTRTKDA
jgi:hypothetical protein